MPRIVDGEGSGTKMDDLLDPPHTETGVDEPVPTVQRLRGQIVDADAETQAIEAACSYFVLGMANERRSLPDSPTSVGEYGTRGPRSCRNSASCRCIRSTRPGQGGSRPCRSERGRSAAGPRCCSSRGC